MVFPRPLEDSGKKVKHVWGMTKWHLGVTLAKLDHACHPCHLLGF